MSFNRKEKNELLSRGFTSHSYSEVSQYDSSCGGIVEEYLNSEVEVSDWAQYSEPLKETLESWYLSLTVKDQLRSALMDATDHVLIQSLKKRYDNFVRMNLIYLNNMPATFFYVAAKHLSTPVEPDVVPDAGLSVCSADFVVDMEFHKFKGKPTGKARNIHTSTSELVPVLEQVSYDADVGLKSKNGQRKLMCAFTHYVSWLRAQGYPSDKICVFGASPGIAISKAASLLGVQVIMVDDYPMPYTDNNRYFSFEDFSNGKVYLHHPDCNALFYDFFDGHNDYHWNYQYMFKVIKRFSAQFDNFFYSLKRFATYGPTMKAYDSSRFFGYPYSSPSSNIFREYGLHESTTLLVPVIGIDNALRHFNQVARSYKNTHPIHVTCFCHDCAIAEMIAIEAFKTNVGLRRDYLDYLSSLGRTVTVTQFNLDAVESSSCDFASQIPHSDSLVASSGVVWDADVFGGSIDSSLLFGSSQFDDSLKRYFRPAVLATFIGDSPVPYTYALPRVNIYDENWFSPTGSGKSYSEPDRDHVFGCPSCGYSPTTTPIPIRWYLASFVPASFSCDHCSWTSNICYAPLLSE